MVNAFENMSLFEIVENYRGKMFSYINPCKFRNFKLLFSYYWTYQVGNFRKCVNLYLACVARLKRRGKWRKEANEQSLDTLSFDIGNCQFKCLHIQLKASKRPLPHLTLSTQGSLSVYKFSLHCPHKISCLVMRIKQMIILKTLR